MIGRIIDGRVGQRQKENHPMYDIKWIRDNAALFDAGLAKRSMPPRAAELAELDDRRKAAIAALQEAQERRNAASREIGQAMAKKDLARAEVLKSEVNALKATLSFYEAQVRVATAALDRCLAEIPNLPAAEVPVGTSEAENVVLRVHGAAKPSLVNQAKEHFEIGERLGLMDFDAAARLSGARFVVLKGELARLERALSAFMLDLHTTEHGYTEVSPPLLVKDEAMFGTAQLPKFVEDQFIAGRMRRREELLLEALDPIEAAALAAFKRGDLSLSELLKATLQAAPTREDLWLIPTAEVPLTNLVRETILEEKQLPLRFAAGTACFRAEAGAAGRDTRGMIRQHQFSKVELVSITTPEQAAREHERMTACAERVLQRLDLHFRTVALCTGDMGFAAQKTYDIEVWLPGQGRFREISSCSVCGDFQARRMGARFRREADKQPQFVYTLNGSGVAIGRALIAVMENYQDRDSSVIIPDVLIPYMGGKRRIELSH
jgi:seryl-tRNA synthetase